MRARKAGRGDSGAGERWDLKQLQRKFVNYRQSDTPGRRVPDSLREAALKVVDSGACSAAAVRRACGVTSSQLSQWRRSKARGARRAKAKEEPRIFPIVADTVGINDTHPSTVGKQHALQFQIGGWAISVRVAEQ
jgi:transposase-like protein